MGLIQSMRISASALLAQRLRMDVIANNVANQNTSRSVVDGQPYRRQMVTFRERGQAIPFRDFLGSARGSRRGGGVEVASIIEDTAPPRRVQDPTHPDADAAGFVLLPNINIVTEMTDLISARRAYEASVTVLNSAKSLALQALRIGRG